MQLFSFAFIFLACTAPAFAQIVRSQANCVTPENYYGYCVRLTYCPQVANVFKTQNRRVAEQYVFALQRNCGTKSVNGDPVVCCTRPITQKATSAPVTPAASGNPFLPRTTTRPIVQSTVAQNVNPFFPTPTPAPTAAPATTAPATVAPATTAPATSSSLIDNRASTCRSPDLRNGVCIELRSCPSLLDELYSKPNDPVFANQLRASNAICGNKGSTVCCPTSSETVTPLPFVRIPNDGKTPRTLPTPAEGCGYTTTSFRKVVGGDVSKKGAWPWIALIGYNDDLASSPFKCGGTLVTARHVVTAAHCIRSDLAFVRLGEHDLGTDAEVKHVDIPVVRTVVHPNYNKRDGHSDIAILYLLRNVEITAYIAPICLPSTPELRSKSYVKFQPFVIGWGKTMEGGRSANILQELQIPVHPNSVCKDSYRNQNRLLSEKQFDSAVICAGVLSGGHDTCQGDSGGPLMIPEPYQGSFRYYLIGVVSYGIGCARPDIPGVYSSTQYFMDWIIQQIADTQ